MKALIAMSGGVDSSVAALLTKEKGIDCIGCTMKLYEAGDTDLPPEKSKTCCSLDDTEDARSVAFRVGMPFYVFNYKEEFRDKVMNKFAESYEKGETPNPCIDCNKYLKFGRLHERAEVLGCDYVVTGHYARIEKQGDKYVLKRALDESKDQSYVLYNLTQELLAHTLFPLGELTKKEAREIAEKHGFVNANKPDSQDICFVPDGDYAMVVKKLTGKDPVPGDFIDKDGKVIGQHKGIINYTIGQRKGLGLAMGHPVFVCAICPENNTVVIGENEDLMKREVLVRDFNWISGEIPAEPVRCTAKTRYRMKDQPAMIYPLEGGGAKIVFDEPQRAITRGQSAVAYDGDIVIGGGVII
ncbi:MAG: tRNA 2-thiouridine(34) synthase MnmA [Firmicutes bacterium]|nr:tRNA 2-thiouridine(34) synthase MnmA [Bacillota bacterium]